MAAVEGFLSSDRVEVVRRNRIIWDYRAHCAGRDATASLPGMPDVDEENNTDKEPYPEAAVPGECEPSAQRPDPHSGDCARAQRL